MTVRAATYALDREIEYLLQQGGAQTIAGGVRHGTSGALVTVTQAGSTVTVLRADGTALVDAQAVTVTGSVATYSVPSTAAETCGAGWTVIWSLIIDGLAYTFRRNAYLCAYVPPCPVHVGHLYGRIPELRSRIPSSQGPNGTDEGWQPQIDAAYYEFLRDLIADGRPVWDLRSAGDYHDRILLRALDLCVKAIPAAEGSTWALAAKQIYFETDSARAKVRLGYGEEPTNVRRGASPVIRLAPVGRPSW